jgi:hypothetical protein
MRGPDDQTSQMFSYVVPEHRVRPDHPLRVIRRMTDEVLATLSPRFDRMYSDMGRPSIPPEQLLRALLLQSLYTIRSERLLMEEIDYSILFRWFIGLGIGVDRTDQARLVRLVAERRSQVGDERGQIVFGDEGPGPQVVEDLLLGQCLRPVLDQQLQQVEPLRCQTDFLSAPQQPPFVEVDDESAKKQTHCGSPHMIARVWRTLCSTSRARSRLSRAAPAV